MLEGDTEPQLSDYEIRCDVIVNRERLLKEFADAIQNVIKMNNASDSKDLYDIGYDNWKENFDKILKFVS